MLPAPPSPRLDRLATALVFGLVAKLYWMSHQTGGLYAPVEPTLFAWGRNLALGLLCHGALAVLLLALVHRAPAPRRSAVLVHLTLAGLAYLDLCFARYHGLHLSFSQASLLREGLAAWDTLLGFVRPQDRWLLVDLPLLLVAAVLPAGAARELAPRRPTLGLLKGSGVLLLGATLHLAWRCAGPDVLARPYNRRLGFPVAWMADALMALRAHRHYDLPGRPASLLADSRQGPAAPRRPTLLLLQVESLEAGAPEWRIDGQLVMPYLARLTRAGVYFPQTLCTRMRGMSFDADVAVLGGFHPPPTSDPYAYRFDRAPYLAGILGRVGYRAVTFYNYVPEFYRCQENHRALGIPRVRSIRDHVWSTRLPRLAAQGPGDREFLGWVGEALAAGPRRTLALVKTISSHGPFDGLVDEAEVVATIGHPFPVDHPLRGYAAALRYVDRSLEAFLAPLQPRIRRGELVVALYGDHGAGMGIAARPTPGLRPDEQARRVVPLLLLGTGRPAARRRQLACLLDLPVTLCRLVGAPFFSGELSGRDLLGDLEGPLVTPEGVFQGGRRRAPTPDQQALLEYGYGKLGAPR